LTSAATSSAAVHSIALFDFLQPSVRPRIAYDVVFRWCEELIDAGLSAVLDLNLGWPFQWEWLEGLLARRAGIQIVPIVLRCPRNVCLERIRRRHALEPGTDGPELYQHDAKIQAVFRFVEELDRSDAVAIDAGRSTDEVFAAARQHVQAVQASPATETEQVWMPRERWDALVRGEACPLCAELSQPDQVNPFGFPVADLAFSRLRLVSNQAVSGYSRFRLSADQSQLPDARQPGPASAHAHRAALLRRSRAWPAA